MKYHDTGTKDPNHALGKWFADILATDIAEFRMQTGYFRIEAVRAISNVLKITAENNLKTHLVIGSNDGDTLHSDITRLFLRMGMPRSEARLTIVQFSNALFHPKVYHFTRHDGTQTAFIGSANFTSPGLTGGNVEAAISLDTREGDPKTLLDQVAAAIDRWVIDPALEGGSSIRNQNDIDALLAQGILAKNRPPRTVKQNGMKAESGTPAAKRSKLITLPPWPDGEDAVEDTAEDDIYQEEEIALAPEPLSEEEIIQEIEQQFDSTEGSVDEVEFLSETRTNFPNYILFEPAAMEPTSGGAALSGQKLPFSAVGLIMKLTKDSARHFYGGKGTANVTIPVAVIKTFRFGVLADSGRPRAEFGLWLRYHSDSLVIVQEARTNVMAYGFMEGETGHGDLRMVMPAAVKKIATEVNLQDQPIPKAGDFFFLEWPTSGSDSFCLTFVAEGSELAQKAEEVYRQAADADRLIGGASSWLPPDLSPAW